MMGHQGRAASAVKFLDPADHANTAAATSSWIDVSRYQGELVFLVTVGVVTAGTITPSLEDADDATGTNSAAVTPDDGSFSAIGTAGDNVVVKVVVDASKVRTHMRFVGTIATGPAIAACSMLAHPGHVGQ